MKIEILSILGAYSMVKQSWYLIWRRRYPGSKPNNTVLMLVLCYILLSFSICSNPLSGFDSATISHPTQILPKAPITPSPTGLKTDSNAESPLKAQLAKVQQIMAGMTLDPASVYEAWCHQRGYVCFIEEIGGIPIKPGESFGTAFIVGFFDSIPEMEKLYDRYRGYNSLQVSQEGWRLAKLPK